MVGNYYVLTPLRHRCAAPPLGATQGHQSHAAGWGPVLEMARHMLAVGGGRQVCMYHVCAHSTCNPTRGMAGKHTTTGRLGAHNTDGGMFHALRLALKGRFNGHEDGLQLLP